MKKIINGKVYDTATAREVGRYSNNLSNRDFHHVDEELYCKRTGEYFLHGCGGPLTQYSVSCGDNSWSGSEKIIPMTIAEAREWAERNMDAEDYEAEFGEVAEDDSQTILSITMRADIAERVRRAAAEAGLSISKYIESKLP